MGKYCDITKDDWRDFSDPEKEKLVDYMKERFIFPEENDAYETCERVLLQSIGHKWRNNKGRLRDFINIDLQNGFTKIQIYGRVPKGVEKSQWNDFVDITLSEAFIEKSTKAKEYRKQQTQTHIGGSKSFVRKRKEMEKLKGGLVGEFELYEATHQKPNGAVNPTSAGVLDKAWHLVEERRASSELDEIKLQSQVIREVRGPEHPGRVRGQGLGPTPSTLFGTKRHATSTDIRRLEAEVELLKKSDVEREAERAERDKLKAEIDSLRKTLYLYVSQGSSS